MTAYVTAAEIRAEFDVLASTTTYPSTMLDGFVARFESVAERARGVAYRRRTGTVSKRARAYRTTTVPWVQDVTIDALSVNEAAFSAEALANLYPVDDEGVLGGGSWCPGDRLVIEATHGFTAPPEGIVDACMEFVRFHALARVNAQPRNVISYTDDSGYTFRESTADWKAGRYTGIRVVDDAINAETDYRLPV